jgi:glycosyltransferase involved in cell wall biosynthesis
MPGRIAYVTPLYFAEQSYVGGGERYVLNLARAVTRAAGGTLAVEVISYGVDARTSRLDGQIKLRVLPTAREPRHPLDAVSWEIAEALRNVDLVHVHQPFTRSGELAIIASKFLGKPVCVTDLGGVASRVGLSSGILDVVDEVIALSRFSQSLFRTATPVSVVKGGVDDEFFSPGETVTRRDRFVYAGRLLPHKGIDRLLLALPRGMPLTICGRPYDEKYYRLLQKLAANKEVEFRLTATDEELRTLYRRAWGVVLPSVYVDLFGSSYVAPELMGLTLLEAAACGAPGICSRVGGLPEFVIDGKTGFVFDSLPDLRGRLRRLARDSELVTRLGTEGQKLVKDRYGLRPVGARILARYEKMLEE